MHTNVYVTDSQTLQAHVYAIKWMREQRSNN